MLASEFIVDRVVSLGVEHVFGVGGANIEDLFSAVQRRRPTIRAILAKHEHAAGTAADAYARIRGFGVVMATSGGGAMNLVHALAEARASGDRVLAIVGEPPTNVQGKGAFQDTSGKAGSVDVQPVFEAAAGCCLRLERPADLPRLWDKALDRVFGASPGPAVLLVAKDYQRAEIDAVAYEGPRRSSAAAALCETSALDHAARWMAAGPIVVIAGTEVTRSSARDQLAAMVERLDARVATTPDGRDVFDNRNPRFLGVAGAMGHAAVARAIAEASLVIVVGTRLPLLARQGVEDLLGRQRLLFVGTRQPFVSSAEMIHLRGDIAPTLERLLTRIGSTELDRRAPSTSPSDDLTSTTAPEIRLTMAVASRAIDRLLPEDAVVIVDAGNTGASAIHHIRAPSRGRFLVAMGMAGMGYAFGAAIGAACATGKRCVVVAGDGAFFMQGMDVHTAVEHELPITYVVANNRAHGMCLVRERLLLGENGGYNVFRTSRLGAGIGAMFPDIAAADCATAGEFSNLFAAATDRRGPSFIGLELEDVEVPPFAAFQERAPDVKVVQREVVDG